MTTLFDIHTHHTEFSHKAIISVTPTEFTPLHNKYYSIGIHPWNQITNDEYIFDLLQQYIQHPQVVALGETGIDRLRGENIEKQIERLDKQIAISEKYKKPLILHVVRGIDIILAMHKKHKPQQPWIIHGFRGNKSTARQLLDKGINISFNINLDVESVLATPLEKLWIESDENTTDITETYKKIAYIKNISIKELTNSIMQRAEKLFFQP